MNSRISLTLTSEDLNLVLIALGQMPYVEVHELIARIQTEAGPQLLAAVETQRERATPDVFAVDD